MPIKRRVLKSKAHRITPDAVLAFESRDWLGLHRALGLKPWEPSPLDADTDDAPQWSRGSAWADAWPKARALREALEVVRPL